MAIEQSLSAAAYLQYAKWLHWDIVYDLGTFATV